MSVANPRSADPTRTATTRKRFAQKLRGEIGDIVTEVNESVGERDVFGVQTDALATPTPLPPLQGLRRDRQVDRYTEWLREQLRTGPLAVVSPEENRFIRAAAAAAIRQADAQLRQAGLGAPTRQERNDAAVLRRRRYRELLQSHYSRTYRELEGMAQATARESQRELDESLASPTTAAALAAVLVGRLNKVGKLSATRTAVTEPVRVHAAVTLVRFEQFGVEEVELHAEYRSAADQYVCDDCEPYDGRVLSLSEARGLIPQHPFCRCRFSVTKG